MRSVIRVALRIATVGAIFGILGCTVGYDVWRNYGALVESWLQTEIGHITRFAFYTLLALAILRLFVRQRKQVTMRKIIRGVLKIAVVGAAFAMGSSLGMLGCGVGYGAWFNYGPLVEPWLQTEIGHFTCISLYTALIFLAIKWLARQSPLLGTALQFIVVVAFPLMLHQIQAYAIGDVANTWCLTTDAGIATSIVISSLWVFYVLCWVEQISPLLCIAVKSAAVAAVLGSCHYYFESEFARAGALWPFVWWGALTGGSASTWWNVFIEPLLKLDSVITTGVCFSASAITIFTSRIHAMRNPLGVRGDATNYVLLHTMLLVLLAAACRRYLLPQNMAIVFNESLPGYATQCVTYLIRGGAMLMPVLSGILISYCRTAGARGFDARIVSWILGMSFHNAPAPDDPTRPHEGVRPA